MRPTRRDIISSALFAFVLIALVVLMVACEWLPHLNPPAGSPSPPPSGPASVRPA